MLLGFTTKICLHVFGVRRGIDYLIRPILLLTLMAGLSAGLNYAILNTTGWALLVDVGMTILVCLPFVALVYVIMLHQISKQRSLISAAQTDDLTGLPNRRAFIRRVEKALRMGRQGYFLIIDADHFKRVNDTLGHPSGDICLKAITDRIESVLRADDLVGRIGGEEFGALLFDRTIEDLQRFSGRLCYPVNVSVPGHSDILRLTVSAGATAISADDTMGTISARADEALIAAKKNGRERMVLWRTKVPRKDAARA